MTETTWADWLGVDTRRALDQRVYAQVELSGVDGSWSVVYAPHCNDAALVRRPAMPNDPCRPLGHWITEAAFARALEDWLDTGRPLGPDLDLPLPVAGPDAVRYVAIGNVVLPGQSMVTDAGPTWPTGAIRRDDWLDARPSRGHLHRDYGFTWADPTETITGTWRLTWSDAAREAFLVRQPDGPDAPLLELGHWPDRRAFESSIPGWETRAERDGLDWLLRATGNRAVLEANLGPTAEIDPVPAWAPPGAQGSISAAVFRSVIGGAIGSSGDTLGQIAESLRVNKDWLVDVMDGEITRVPATLAARLAREIGTYPEDMWGPEAGAAIGWAYGVDIHPDHLDRAGPAPKEPPPPAPSR